MARRASRAQSQGQSSLKPRVRRRATVFASASSTREAFGVPTKKESDSQLTYVEAEAWHLDKGLGSRSCDRAAKRCFPRSKVHFHKGYRRPFKGGADLTRWWNEEHKPRVPTPQDDQGLPYFKGGLL